jgi:hypothetical protein
VGAPTNTEPQNSEDEEPDLTYRPHSWKPNRAHHASMRTYGLDPTEVTDLFKAQSVGHRRSNWGSTFGEYINAYSEDRHEEIFRGPAVWFTKQDNWIRAQVANGGCTIDQVEQHLYYHESLQSHQREYIIEFCKQNYVKTEST